MKLKDKVAIITGGAAGIGLASAKLFLEEGARVAIIDINEEKTQAAAKSLAHLGEIRGYACDVSKKEPVDDTVARIAKDFGGGIDILINNAGITKDAQFYKMDTDNFEAVISVNLMGNVYMTKAVVPYMMEQRYGKIVHCSSVSGFNGSFGQSNYAASKAGIVGMMRVQAKELGKYGINVNAVSPGTIYTDMFKAVPEDILNKKVSEVALKRMGQPEDVAKLYVFLASDDSSFITGQNITIDGGRN